MMINIRIYQLLVLFFWVTNFIRVQAQPLPPINDDACNAILLDLVITIDNMTVDTATIQPGEEMLTPPLSSDCGGDFWCDDGITGSIWYKFIAPESQGVLIDLCNSEYNTQLAAYQVADCDDFSTFRFIRSNEDSDQHLACGSNTPFFEFNSQLRLRCLNPGEEYYLLVDQWSPDGDFTPGSVNIFVVNSPPDASPPMSLTNIQIQKPTCSGGSNGSARLGLSNGVDPINYIWNTGDTTATISGLSEGQIVAVTITDFCETIIEATDTVPFAKLPDGPLKLKEIISLPAYCAPGYASVQLEGGTLPYSVKWNDGSTGAFLWLDKGIYTATITDACEVEVIITDEIIIEGNADAGPDLVLDCGLAQLGSTTPFDQKIIDRSISYSTNPSMGPGFACRQPNGIINENGILRVFDLNDFAIDTDYHLDAIEVAINSAQTNFTGLFPNPFPLTQALECRIHEVDTADLSIANFNLVYTKKVHLPNITSARLFSFPIDYTVPANQLIAVEIWNPSGNDFVSQLVLGSNAFPTLFNNPTWIRADECGFTTPVKIKDLGSPMETVINLVQYKNSFGNLSYSWTPTHHLDDPSSPNPIVDFSATAGLLTYTLKMTDDNGCVSTSIVKVNASAFSDYAGRSGSLSGGGDACYQSTLSATTNQAPVIPHFSNQTFALSYGEDQRLLQFSDNPSFDLSQLDYTSLGIPDCGIFTIHSLVYANRIDIPTIISIFQINTVGELAEILDEENLCASLDVAGASYTVACDFISLSVATSVENCGQADASASLNSSTGTPPYSYQWSNGQSEDMASNLSAGNYSVTLTDAIGCVAIEEFSVQNSADFLGNWTVTAVSCNGNDDGKISVEPNGGIAPISYIWDNGAIDKDLENLIPGAYSVTLTDANGCSFASAEIFVPEPDSLMLFADSIVRVTCNGFDDGQIITLVEGGTAPYSYFWSNGAVDEGIKDLIPGNYSLTVLDANSCQFISEEWTITEPLAIAISHESVQHISCFGDSHGSIFFGVSGGAEIYSYEWSDGTNQANIFDLTSGTYQVTVMDVNGCIFISPEYLVTEPDKLELTLASIFNPRCTFDGNGSITIEANGGTPPFAYSWSNGSTDGPTISNLYPGVYSLEVTDSNFCTSQFLNLILTDPPKLELDGFVYHETNVGSDGVVWIKVDGGFGEYTYEWSNGVVGTHRIMDLEPGVYCVTVTDENDCTVGFCGEVDKYVGIDEVRELEKLDLFPNPTSGEVQLNLEFIQEVDVELEIINTLGQQLWKSPQEKVLSQRYALDFGDHPNGVYLVKIKVDKSLIVKRLVVHK